MKRFRKMTGLVLGMLMMMTALEACGSKEGSGPQKPQDKTQETAVPGGEDSKVLVAYFSATGTTKKLAEYAAEVMGADLYEIVPAEPYTDADLNYSDRNSRTSIEMNDASIHPAIDGSVEDMGQYDIVFIGYPIWWSDAPRIVCTFLESYDFSGKTMIPLCTSASSGISGVESRMKKVCNGSATWLPGKRFSGSAGKEEVKQWISGLELASRKAEDNRMYIKVNNQVLKAEMADNSSAKALLELLKDGDITIAAHDFSNFEKVGELGTTLPTNDEEITTEAGDLILYLGHNFVLYYDTNTWNFTRLGKVVGVTQAELKRLLGTGNVTMVLTLNP